MKSFFGFLDFHVVQFYGFASLTDKGNKGWGKGGIINVYKYLSTDHNHAPIRCPRDGEPLPAQGHHSSTELIPHVPEPTGSIPRDGRQLCIFGRVESHTLDSGRVPLELRAVLHLGFLWVPNAQRTVSGSGRY